MDVEIVAEGPGWFALYHGGGVETVIDENFDGGDDGHQVIPVD